MFERYHTVIIENADRFLEDLDEQIKDHYKKVAEQIERNSRQQQSRSRIICFHVSNAILQRSSGLRRNSQFVYNQLNGAARFAGLR